MSFYRGVPNAIRLRNGAFCGLRLTVQSQYATRKLSTTTSHTSHWRRISQFVSPASRRSLSFFGWTTGKKTPAAESPAGDVTPPPHSMPASSSSLPLNEETTSLSNALSDNQPTRPALETLTQTSGFVDQSSLDPSLISNSDLSSVSSSVIEPIGEHIGDLHAMGLARFTPVGAVQAALEFVHVMTGMPWWGSIITVTVLLRVIGVHFSLLSLRASAKSIPLRPKIAELQEEMQEAKASGDLLKKQMIAIKIRNLQLENGISIWPMLLGPAYQILTSIIGFFAVKRASDLPIPQMQAESFFWIPSITATDPYAILPLLSGAIALVQSRVTRPDMKATGSPISLHLPNVMPFLSIFSVLILLQLPVAPTLSILTNMFWMVLQSRIFQIPRLREALGLLPLPKVNKGDFPSIRETGRAIVTFFKNRHAKALAEHQQKLKQRPHFPARDNRSTGSNVQK